MTSPCTRCGQQIERDFLEFGRCIGCRKEYNAVKGYARWVGVNRTQMAQRIAKVKDRTVKRARGKFAPELG